jgi:hypothetical protein
LQGEFALTGHCRYFEREFGKEGELVVRISGIMKSARGKCIHPILQMFRKQKGKTYMSKSDKFCKVFSEIALTD